MLGDRDGIAIGEPPTSMLGFRFRLRAGPVLDLEAEVGPVGEGRATKAQLGPDGPGDIAFAVNLRRHPVECHAAQ